MISKDFQDTEATAEPFDDPDPFDELAYPNMISAKQAISDFLGMPLARLSSEQLEKD